MATAVGRRLHEQVRVLLATTNCLTLNIIPTFRRLYCSACLIMCRMKVKRLLEIIRTDVSQAAARYSAARYNADVAFL